MPRRLKTRMTTRTKKTNEGRHTPAFLYFPFPARTVCQADPAENKGIDK